MIGRWSESAGDNDTAWVVEIDGGYGSADTGDDAEEGHRKS